MSTPDHGNGVRTPWQSVKPLVRIHESGVCGLNILTSQRRQYRAQIFHGSVCQALKCNGDGAVETLESDDEAVVPTPLWRLLLPGKAVWRPAVPRLLFVSFVVNGLAA